MQILPAPTPTGPVTITVTTDPPAGSTIAPGSLIHVYWAASGMNSADEFKIDFTDAGGTFVRTIGSSIPGSSREATHNPVPSSLSGSHRVRVMCTGGINGSYGYGVACGSGFSDTFTISASSMAPSFNRDALASLVNGLEAVSLLLQKLTTQLER